MQSTNFTEAIECTRSTYLVLDIQFLLFGGDQGIDTLMGMTPKELTMYILGLTLTFATC